MASSSSEDFETHHRAPNIYYTPPKTNIAPENRPLEKGNSYWSNPPFAGAIYVRFREGNASLKRIGSN